MNVMTSGLYLISSDSSINTYGYLYKTHFNPLNKAKNYLDENDEACANNQFRMVNNLQANVTYVLVVTTHYPEMTGKFAIFISGPNQVIFNRISEYMSYHRVMSNMFLFLRSFYHPLPKSLHSVFYLETPKNFHI